MTLIAGLTLSLDGYFEAADGTFAALYSDFEELLDSPYMKASQAETGAVLMGRRTFDMAGDPDSYAVDYEYQVPLFVLTHRAAEREPQRNENLSVTFVTAGLASAVAPAPAAAGDRAVTVVGGADLNRQLLAAGLADELRIDIMPVLLGGGRRLFDGLPPGVRLEKIGVEEVGVRTCLSFRVLR
ncbi:MAG: dihydrofolate reductase [Blastococcus sp.]|nr:dihydrofolate reductase [Blastococcus sp.]